MKGYFTVELSIIFPVIFVILVILMQCGLFFSYRIFAINAMNQSLMVCEQARDNGYQPEEAVEFAKEYLERELTKLPVQINEMEWEQTSGWLKEEYRVKVSAQYSFVIMLSWSSEVGTKRMNPAEFRNRVDFIWEKGRQYLDGEND